MNVNWIEDQSVGVGQETAPKRESLADRVRSWKPEVTVRVEPGPVAIVLVAASVAALIWYGMSR
jgi:hypothetical protein